MLEDNADISVSLKLDKNSERVFQPEDFVVIHCLDDVHWNRKLIMEEGCDQGLDGGRCLQAIVLRDGGESQGSASC